MTSGCCGRRFCVKLIVVGRCFLSIIVCNPFTRCVTISSELVPEASFVIGHGQMDEHELEAVMADFSAGEYDVLLCTTIIENGIDIPRANTIIIDRADRFGLSQLYQLRGRVGRSAHQGYAYMFYPRNQPLSPEARARLGNHQRIHRFGCWDVDCHA